MPEPQTPSRNVSHQRKWLYQAGLALQLVGLALFLSFSSGLTDFTFSLSFNSCSLLLLTELIFYLSFS